MNKNQKLILKQLKYGFEIIIQDVTFFGSLIFYLFISVLFFLINLNYIAFIELIISLILAYIITIIIRIIYFKNRPNIQKYTDFLEKIDCSSFPSMHAMRSSILCILFYINYGLLFGLFFLFLMILVGFSRYYLKKHYIIDILVGYLFGFIIGFFINYFILFLVL